MSEDEKFEITEFGFEGVGKYSSDHEIEMAISRMQNLIDHGEKKERDLCTEVIFEWMAGYIRVDLVKDDVSYKIATESRAKRFARARNAVYEYFRDKCGEAFAC